MEKSFKNLKKAPQAAAVKKTTAPPVQQTAEEKKAQRQKELLGQYDVVKALPFQIAV